MEPAARRRLAEFIRSEGMSLADDPQRVRALLLDTCPEAKTEISLLTLVVEDEIPLRLVRSSADAVMKDGAIARAIADLRTTRRVDRSAAEWAVGSWAWALGLSSTEPQDDLGDQPGSTEPVVVRPDAEQGSTTSAGGSSGSVGSGECSDGSGGATPPPAPARPFEEASSQPGHEGAGAGYPNPGLGNPAAPYPPGQGVGSYPPGPGVGSYPPGQGVGSYPPGPGVGSYPPGPTYPTQQSPTYPPPPPPRGGSSRAPLIVGIGGAIVAALVLLVGGGVALAGLLFPDPAPTPAAPTTSASAPTTSPAEEADFTITDHLVSGEASERVTVYLNGRKFGELSIDQSRRDDELSGTAEVGSYEYQLDAYITFVDDAGNAQNAHITGRGTIYVSGNVTFAVDSVRSGGRIEFILKEVS
jgi:hypothetical protein